MVVAPHTSNWDFIIGLAYRNILGMGGTRFLGKEALFKPPFGFIFYWLGGTPVNRKNSQQMVNTVASLFLRHTDFVLALSPEGTRSKVDKLRTGFYFMAKKANVPIVMVGLDYRHKRVVIHQPFLPTENQDADMKHILSFFRSIEGKHPENGLAHL